MSKKNVVQPRLAQALLRVPPVGRRPAPEAQAIQAGAGPRRSVPDVPAVPGIGWRR